MAEPISAVLGVLAFTIQVVQSSKTLFELVADLRGAPAHIKAISTLHSAFASVGIAYECSS